MSRRTFWQKIGREHVMLYSWLILRNSRIQNYCVFLMIALYAILFYSSQYYLFLFNEPFSLLMVASNFDVTLYRFCRMQISFACCKNLQEIWKEWLPSNSAPIQWAQQRLIILLHTFSTRNHTWVAIALAVFLLSPVISTTSTPIFCNMCIAKAASGLTVSAIAIMPQSAPTKNPYLHLWDLCVMASLGSYK